ncbi:hypothetical protein RB195_007728 [Necator americanus]|uniref:Thrombospondin type 1 domain protein n=1 Tax=Necator americanus TaxID=51031 RepID=A0ABR1C218_NECAM
MFEVSDSYVLEENGIRIGMFSVGPPDIEIRVPQTHHMLHELNVQIVPKLCLAEKFTVNLLYRPIDVLPDERWIVIATSFVVFHTESVQITFPCENFTNAGLYRVDLVNSQGFEIQGKQWILVNDTSGVSLELRNDSIFPHCTKDFLIRWNTVKCDAARLSYRLRVLAIPEGSNNQEHRSHYIEEIDIPRGQSSLSIGCSQFDIFYVKYCFELVSVDLRSSVFHLWKSTCVNTEPAPVINATWGSWSAWSECSATCGESIQKRYRFCENPEPKRGVDCVGEMTETRTCVVPDCLTLIKSHGMLTNCSCGCALNGTSGSFFATVADAEKCGGNQTWYMSARTNSVVSDFSVAIDPNAAGKLFFFLRAPYEELVWFSGSNQEQEFTLRLDRPIFVVLWYKGNNSAIKGRKGFTISFSTREVTNQFPTRNAPSCQPLCPETVIIALLSLIFLFIICFPPFLCASLTRRLRTRNCHDRPLLDKIYDSEMIRSGNTEYTQASGEKPAAFTAQRSIGIQLSVQSTPRCARTCVPSDSPQPHHGTSISTTDELEYDYYDGTTIPGSLLAPVDDLLMCEIEIDQIIAHSSLYSKPVETHDMYTQV